VLKGEKEGFSGNLNSSPGYGSKDLEVLRQTSAKDMTSETAGGCFGIQGNIREGSIPAKEGSTT